MNSWGGFADRIAGMIDGLFGLSPEQRKVKIKDKIDDLERQKSAILIHNPDAEYSRKLSDINDRLVRLYEQLKNLA